MTKSISILDKDYSKWIQELSSRYRRSQIKAAVKVNQEMLQFYWELGRDIVERDAENKYGSGFYEMLSKDLKDAIPMTTGFSDRNLRYAKKFYSLYNEELVKLQQVAAKSQLSLCTVDKTSLYSEDSSPTNLLTLAGHFSNHDSSWCKKNYHTYSPHRVLLYPCPVPNRNAAFLGSLLLLL